MLLFVSAAAVFDAPCTPMKREPRITLSLISVVDGTAYVESAQATGLHLLADSERDPRRTTSYGAGQLVAAALAAGARRVIVGLGGSGTNDGGAGAWAALGGAADVDLSAGGGALTGLGDLQALTGSFPSVQFAAVALRADREHLRRLEAEKGLSFPLGLDRSGKLLVLYKMASCPQVTFAYPGGVVQSPALLRRVSLSELRARVRALAAASRARGWRGSAG